MRWTLIGGAAIVVFDAVTALAARPLGYEYGSLPGVLVSWAIAFVPAYMAAREARTIRAGVLTGAGVSAVDATIGWAVSWAIGPGAIPEPSFAVIASIVALVIATGAALGLVAGVIARRMNADAWDGATQEQGGRSRT